ncbi:MAG: molybdopterin-binding protein [Firmicutes bacterium]|nr:molybdopterin-binding protein [Bacillota bacterium]
MEMKRVKIEEAIGRPLAYDLTKIVPGFKGPVFRRGHLITPQDLPELRAIGKAEVVVFDLEPGVLHEDEAARRLVEAIGGANLEIRMPGEGWADLASQVQGLLKVDISLLEQFNGLGEVEITTLHNNTPVKVGELVAKAKVLGLTVAEDQIRQVEEASRPAGIIGVLPFQRQSIGLIVTGNEVAGGLVQDRFTDLVEERLAEYGSRIGWRSILPDYPEEIARRIQEYVAAGADMVIVTGGLSPDDTTPVAIRSSGARIISHGAPVSPGAMFLLAELEGRPLLGVPAGALGKPRSMFDLVLPRFLVGERLSRRDIVRYGHGGICINCSPCTFPHCSFGKGS